MVEPPVPPAGSDPDLPAPSDVPRGAAPPSATPPAEVPAAEPSPSLLTDEVAAEGVAEAAGAIAPAEEPPVPPAGSEPDLPAPSDAPRGRRDLSKPQLVLGLVLVLIAAAYLRFVGLDWDQGAHLHPDERFLTMVQGSLSLPASLKDYLSTDTSTLNPRNVGHAFFVYGTWPMTVVQLVGTGLANLFGPPPAAPASGSAAVLPRWMYGGTSYGDVYLVGRALSAISDLLALVLLCAVGTMLHDRRVGLLAATLGAFTAFQIQQSHFFTVDTMTNLFVMVFFLGAVAMVHRGSWRGTVVAGLGMGFGVASKIAVFLLAPVAVLAVAVVTWHRAGRDWPAWRVPVGQVVLLGLVAFTTLRLAQPDMWAGVGWNAVEENPQRMAEVAARVPAGHWWHTLRQIMPAPVKPILLPDPRWVGNMEEIQSQVSGKVDFPPNHQWWHRAAYWFPWRNLVLYGLGPALGLLATLAWAVAGIRLWRGDDRHLLPWLWVTVVFLYYGGQWVKTMRYLLVIYPLLTLLAAWALVALWDRARAVGYGTARSNDCSARM